MKILIKNIYDSQINISSTKHHIKFSKTVLKNSFLKLFLKVVINTNLYSLTFFFSLGVKSPLAMESQADELLYHGLSNQHNTSSFP